MRINVLLPSVAIGGGTRVIFEYANRLSKRGHEVYVITPIIPPRNGKGWFDPRARLSQIYESIRRTVVESSVTWFDLDADVIEVPTINPRFVSLFEDRIPSADVTIASSWETAYAVSALDERAGEKAYFVQHYEIWDVWNDDQSWEQVAEIVDSPSQYPIAMSRITPKDDRKRKQKELVDTTYTLPLEKIVISSWLEDLVETRFDQTVAGVVPNSVNHDDFYYDSDTTGQHLSVLLPYRRELWKGRNEVKRIANRIIERYSDVEVHVYSPYSSGDELPDEVIFHSKPTDDELRKLYSKSDIFALPSWAEGWGLPAFEALACQCAVVATNVGGVSQCLTDERNARIVPPRDVTSMTDAVCELIEDDEARALCKQRGHKYIQGYTWEDAAERLEKILYDITG